MVYWFGFSAQQFFSLVKLIKKKFNFLRIFLVMSQMLFAVHTYSAMLLKLAECVFDDGWILCWLWYAEGRSSRIISPISCIISLMFSLQSKTQSSYLKAASQVSQPSFKILFNCLQLRKNTLTLSTSELLICSRKTTTIFYCDSPWSSISHFGTNNGTVILEMMMKPLVSSIIRKGISKVTAVWKLV